MGCHHAKHILSFFKKQSFSAFITKLSPSRFPNYVVLEIERGGFFNQTCRVFTGPSKKWPPPKLEIQPCDISIARSDVAPTETMRGRMKCLCWTEGVSLDSFFFRGRCFRPKKGRVLHLTAVPLTRIFLNVRKGKRRMLKSIAAPQTVLGSSYKINE